MFGRYRKLNKWKKNYRCKKRDMSKNMLYMGRGSIRFSRFGNILTEIGIELYLFFDRWWHACLISFCKWNIKLMSIVKNLKIWGFKKIEYPGTVKNPCARLGILIIQTLRSLGNWKRILVFSWISKFQSSVDHFLRI